MVSVIIPTRNEENHIEKCLDSILAQDYPIQQMEVLLVDGLSEDSTCFLIEAYIEKYPNLFRLISNPQRITPIGMNLGICAAKGDFIIRMDAHSEYENSYVSKCIKTLETVQADNVGGIVLNKSTGIIGEAFSQVLLSKFGVGNSSFRTSTSSGFVDTVPFGAFPKVVFSKFGLYDERLLRNQDYELNYRIRKGGGKIYLNSEIIVYYHCKNTISGIMKQSFNNGKWNVITMKLCPGSMGIRHFIPFLFVISLLAWLIGIFGGNRLVMMAGILEILLYLGLDVFFSVFKCGNQYKNHFITKLMLFPVFHIAYGIGSCVGLLKNK